ncbi:aldehyde dehydrogenase family protein, partial [Lysinibacillus fusiformis]
VVNRVEELTNALTVGDPTDFSNFMATVIDQAAFNKITEYIEIGKGEGRLVAGGTADDSVGYFVQPTVFADVEPSARIMKEEIFGPVVAIAKAKDFDQAIEIANDTEYGLTGAV